MITLQIIEKIAFLLIGASIGIYIERIRKRYNDLHKLELCIEEIEDFEGELIACSNPPDEEYLHGVKEYNFKKIEQFLETESSFNLIIEARESFKSVIRIIQLFNEELTQYKKREISCNKFIESINSINKLLEGEKNLIENSYLYMKSKRYKWFGLKPNELKILKIRNKE